MFDWLSILLSPVIGAGASSILGKFMKKEPEKPEAPVENLAAVNRRLAKIGEWQIQMEDLLKAQERQILQLKKLVAATRFFGLVCLLVVLVACVVWFYTLSRLP